MSHWYQIIHVIVNTEITLQWRHNECGGVSNHQRLHCLLNCWFRRRSKKTTKFRVIGLSAGNSPVTGEFPTQRAVTWKMFPFDDVIMIWPNYVALKAVSCRSIAMIYGHSFCSVKIHWRPPEGHGFSYRLPATDWCLLDMFLLQLSLSSRATASHLWNFMITSSNGNISALLLLCEGNHRSSVNSPHKGQWHGALMFSFICAWTNGWSNNLDDGSLRRHRAYYDVIVMWPWVFRG